MTPGTASNTYPSTDGAPRILRLAGAEPGPWSVELHPRLTVIGGLDPVVTGAVRALLGALAAGDLPDAAVRDGLVAGTVSVEGRAEPLSGAVASGHLRVPSAHDRAVPAPEATAGRLDAEIDRANATLSSAAAAVADVWREWATDRDGWAEAQRRGWHDRADAAAALRRARTRRAEAEATLAPPVEAPVGDQTAAEGAGAPDEGERYALLARLAVLEAELSDLRHDSVHGVAAAVDALDRYRVVDVDEAERLADAWEEARRRIDRVALRRERAPGPTSDALGAARDRVRAAEALVAAAERALADAGAPAASPDTAALEAAHAEVLLAWDAGERRVGVGRARRRLEEAQALEQELLDRLGFKTYTEFMVSGRMRVHGSREREQAAREDLRRAEAELEAATADLATIEGAGPSGVGEDTAGDTGATGTDGEAEIAEADAIRAEAAALLGGDPGEDVAVALRGHLAADPLARLRMALAEARVPIAAASYREAVATLAREWLDATRDVADRRSELDAERAVLRERLETLDRAGDAATGTRPTTDGDLAARTSVLDAMAEDERDARSVLDAAVAALALPAPDPAPAGSLVDRRARAEGRMAMAQVELESLRRARVRPPVAPDLETTGPTDAAAVAWNALTRVAAHHRLAGDAVPPLVLDDPFGDLSGADAVSVVEALVDPAAIGQIVVLTERAEVLSWAASLGPDDGALVVAGGGDGA